MFLHWQERVLESAGGSAASERAFFLPTEADDYVAALHRWINNHGGEPFAGQPLPPRQNVDALMDRYHSHTVHCRSCSQALRWIRIGQPWCWVALWTAAVLIGLGQMGWLSASGVLLAVISALFLQRLRQWERGLTAGDGLAPRNDGT